MTTEPDNSQRTIAVTGVITLATILIGGAITIENRYAKVADVSQQIETFYEKTIQLRILELELKGNKLEPHERALLNHLKRELNNGR